MNAQPLISVIVPIYNAESFLETCLQSIRQQTYTHLEVLLIDDGSTDGSTAIARQFSENDTRFRFFTQANAGPSCARNAGLNHATGDFISFVDADDFLAHDFYAHLLAYIGEADMLCFGYTLVDKNGRRHAHLPHHCYQYISNWSYLLRRDFVEQHQLRFIEGLLYEDALFMPNVWCHNPKTKLIRYTGYFYRRHDHSITAQKHDTRILFNLLRQYYRSARTGKQRRILLYTMTRLRLHFLLGKR